MLLLLVVLCAAQSSGVVIGTGSRASTLQLAPTGTARGPLGMPPPVDLVMLTDVISPAVLQRGAAGAARFALDAALGEVVTLEPRKPDDVLKQLGDEEEVTLYGRVRIGKVWLHETLLKSGQAWVAPAARGDAALMKLEADARAAKLGLWAEPAPLEPWLWRELIMLGDRETKVVHSGWECPHVKATQCKKCGGGRYYGLDEAKAAGFAPHEACFTAELTRIAAASGEGPDSAEHHDGPPLLPPSARRACASDAECDFAPPVPCTCPGCGGVWKVPVRKDVAARMTSGFGKVTCGGIGCPACAGHSLGKKAVCREGQCAVAQ